jgi:hypothetical protein
MGTMRVLPFSIFEEIPIILHPNFQLRFLFFRQKLSKISINAHSNLLSLQVQGGKRNQGTVCGLQFFKRCFHVLDP